MTKYTYIRPNTLEDIVEELAKIIEYKRYDKLNYLLSDIEWLQKDDFELFDKNEFYDLMFDKGLF
ncbi:hypothetical protein JL916_04120 [Staphylococcus pseudintermedius]|nr:hypothetical protein [Staphylococcus pseudintermedius]EGQ1664820.1 hypothetical protein [Staphylococcus pseudintermedius]EGQ2843469.1 hypothetical protein [Staphylococcus pseudintermedius]EGQ3198067.1 hypothetical protein [Staphylococcus pseudintermedius]EGQ3204512.1 hypothetical protein [Staphylococcus pseudintermedius]EGQ3665823.1 hypothetical protein [Staphylococcus pseudintermedius]